MILEQATYEKFGYYPSEIPSRSWKKVIQKCDGCGDIKEKPKHDYRNLCQSCSCAKKGRIVSEETRKKMSKSHEGKSHTEETKQKMCGRVAWNKDKLLSEVHKQKISNSLIGNIRTKGYMPSEETRSKISKANKGRKCSEEHNRKITEWHRGKPRTKETIRKMSEGHKGQPAWNRGKTGIYSEDTLQKIREARKKQIIPKHHTTPELFFESLCEKYQLPYKYTGDGAFWIENVNPDFINCNGKKVAIEIFGDYWHSPLLNPKLSERSTAPYREKILKKYGWKLVVLWETDLKRDDAEKFVLSVLGESK